MLKALKDNKKNGNKKRKLNNDVSLNNPYFKLWEEKMKGRIGNLLSSKIGKDERISIIEELDFDWIEKYCWAIPSVRALEAIKHVVGERELVEIGCGSGYWGHLLLELKVGWRGFDMSSITKSKWAKVEKKGPEILDSLESNLEGPRSCILFLCYPDDYRALDTEVDEDEEPGPDEQPFSLALDCFDRYRGDTIIHVGELLSTGTLLENPWGRTTAEDFQLALHCDFHKVLSLPLPAWPLSRDFLTVWKRTKKIEVKNEELDMEIRMIDKSFVMGGSAAPFFRSLLDDPKRNDS